MYRRSLATEPVHADHRAAMAVVLTLAGFSVLAAPVVAQDRGAVPAADTAFTYQGQLLFFGSPAEGIYDLQFRLLDTTAGAEQIAETVNVYNAAVTDGRFAVPLDFGTDVFGGDHRVTVSVRLGAGGFPTQLSSGQPVVAVPYTLAMPNVHSSRYSPFVCVGTAAPSTGTNKDGC